MGHGELCNGYTRRERGALVGATTASQCRSSYVQSSSRKGTRELEGFRVYCGDKIKAPRKIQPIGATSSLSNLPASATAEYDGVINNVANGSPSGR